MNLPPPTEKQARLIWAAVTGLALATLAALLVVLIWGLGKVLHLLAPVLWPIAVAAVLACLLDPVVDFLERKRVPRTRAIVVVFAAALLLVAALFGSVVPQVVVETGQLAARIPSYATNVQAHAEAWISHPPAWVREFLDRPREAPTTLPAPGTAPAEPSPGATNAPDRSATEAVLAALDKETVGSATAWLARALPTIGSWLFGQLTRVASWFGVLVGLVLVPIYAFFFLREKRGITARWHDYLPVADSRFKEELVFILDAVNEYLIAFFRGQVLVGMCNGVLYTIGFTLIGLPYSVLLGVLATILTIVPFIGAIVTCVLALLIAVVNFGDWPHPLWVLAVFGIVVTLENTVVAPKIMGDRVGLHPLVIIIALMAGTTLLGGLLGGILAIPLAAALRVVMFRYVWKKRGA